ncbi:S8 family peptidase [Arcicella lustrica]|uniref:S8 family peptidase n=1 Tax=Arcicella lustrica TaxID=2984196 RepID=A0ABU5SGL1_9BACT|nr:S8 family peptidase [Arcicella sp. DC25W]MEA5426405.1 S8 family peptidase [Arcicella sp. DC25W]
MEQFPHLNFIGKVSGRPRLTGGGGSRISDENKSNRSVHAGKLQRWVTSTKSDWHTSLDDRSNDLAAIDTDIVPIFIKFNPGLIGPEFDLERFGIEIISEEEDGFIIGASLDNFRTLEEKINGFINSSHGTAQIADFWSIFDGDRSAWRRDRILSEQLFSKWDEIVDTTTYNLEVSVAFSRSIGSEPDRLKKGGEKRLEEYRRKQVERDELLLQRQNHFQEFIATYGRLISSIVEFGDSFGCEVAISGIGLKDLVTNYQFVFEVNEIEEVSGIEGGTGENNEIDIEILPPNASAVTVAVIDSGIMEGNKYISAAIDPTRSLSYLKNDASKADYVAGGGHGTKVAGAVLFPKGVSQINQPYQLPCFIRNVRILNALNQLTDKYPAELMQRVVADNADCKIFNLSVGSRAPYRFKHMSTWATSIDKLMHENNVLFLIAAGNISKDDIRYYLSNGLIYPNYLEEPDCRLSNPAQSSFALSVGSINHSTFTDHNWTSIGDVEEVSAYSRIGTGIWGHIKPDVVEYGGGMVESNNGMRQINYHTETSTELIRSTLHGGTALGRDSAGTSFATPKVAHIASLLWELYPDEGVNLIRALIVQGARLPSDHFFNPTINSIRHFGYGLPSLDRVTRNSDHRITFYNTGTIKAEEANLFSLKLPAELLNPGNEFDILIEVTLSYTANVRRTRQKTKSYLSTWLDWTSSKLDEKFEVFTGRTLVDLNNDRDNVVEDDDSGEVIKWKIRERSDWGSVDGLNRNNSTIQKDWVILKSYELPEEIGFSVRGHKGWDKDHRRIPYALTVSVEILGANIPIYESIRSENRVEIEAESETEVAIN